MTKVDCLTKIYESLGGEDSIRCDASVCCVLDKIAEIIPSVIEPPPLPKYTMDETIVATWIDGKPIYRKVIQSTVEKVQDDLNALGADRVTNFFGEALSNYGNWFLIPCKNPASIDYGNADHYTIAIIQSNQAARNFQITFGDYYNSSNAVNIIIEYTKKGA